MKIALLKDGQRFEARPLAYDDDEPWSIIPNPPRGLTHHRIALPIQPTSDRLTCQLTVYIGTFDAGGGDGNTLPMVSAWIVNGGIDAEAVTFDAIEITDVANMAPAYARAGYSEVDGGWLAESADGGPFVLPPGFCRTVRFMSTGGDLAAMMRRSHVAPAGEPDWNESLAQRGDDSDDSGALRARYWFAAAAVAENKIDPKGGLYIQEVGGLRPYGHPFGGLHGGDGIYPSQYWSARSWESFMLAMIQFDLSMERMGLWLLNADGAPMFGSRGMGGGRHWPDASWPEHREALKRMSGSNALRDFGFYDAQHLVRWWRGHKHVESLGDPMAHLATRVYATVGLSFFSRSFGVALRPGWLNRENSWSSYAVAVELCRVTENGGDEETENVAIDVAARMVQSALGNGIGKAVWGKTSTVPQRGYPSPMPWVDRLTGYDGAVYGNGVVMPIDEGQCVSFEEGLGITARMKMARGLMGVRTRKLVREAQVLASALVNDCTRSIGYMGQLTVTSPAFKSTGKAGTPQFVSCVQTTPRFVALRKPNSWAGGSEIVTSLNALGEVGRWIGPHGPTAAQIASMLHTRLGLGRPDADPSTGTLPKLEKLIESDSRDGYSASADVMHAAYVFLRSWYDEAVAEDRILAIRHWEETQRTLIDFEELGMQTPADSTRPPLVVVVPDKPDRPIEIPPDVEVPVVIVPPDPPEPEPDPADAPPVEDGHLIGQLQRMNVTRLLDGLRKVMERDGLDGQLPAMFRKAGWRVTESPRVKGPTVVVPAEDDGKPEPPPNEIVREGVVQ